MTHFKEIKSKFVSSLLLSQQIIKETARHLEPITQSVSATTSPICEGTNLTITVHSLGTGSNIIDAINANNTANIATTDFEAYPNSTDGLLHVVIRQETMSHSQLQR